MAILLFVLVTVFPTTVPQDGFHELVTLRTEYISAMNEYLTNLAKLKSSYEKSIVLAKRQNDTEAVERFDKRIADIDRKAIEARFQLDQLPSVAQLEREHRKAMAARRTARKPACDSWVLTASRRQRKRSVAFTYKLVCTG